MKREVTESKINNQGSNSEKRRVAEKTKRLLRRRKITKRLKAEVTWKII